MIGRINKFLFVFCVVALALYVVILNSTSVAVNLGPHTTYSGSVGVVLIISFTCGIVIAGLVGLFFGIKSYIRERRFQSLAAQRKAFYEGMLRARGFAASGEWNKARAQWEQLIRKDPTDVIARTELSRSLQASGELVEALRILDAARAADPKNTEVLFRAAELNLALGNKTAAIDNLALIIQTHPNKRATGLARDLSEDLGRIEDAIEYQAQVTALGSQDAEMDAIGARLEFKRILKDSDGKPEELRTALRSFGKKFPDFVPGLHRLALLEAESGNLDEAAQSYVKAARASRSSAYWNEIAKLWMKKGDPDRALSAARSAVKETQGEARLIAQLELIRIQLSLNQFEEARRALDEFQKNAGVSLLSAEITQQYLILRGLYLSQSGSHAQAAEVWKKLSQNDLALNSPYVPGTSRSDDAPAARLSTP